MTKVVKVVPLVKNRLKVFFNDGRHGICDISDLIHGSVFTPLSDDGFFNHVAIDESGGVFWPNGADICPDLLYSMTFSSDS
ncbi:DUF2442 domain-containing protein [bacterium]|nr:DUF2442 domain-containing protein [bacterium]